MKEATKVVLFTAKKTTPTEALCDEIMELTRGLEKFLLFEDVPEVDTPAEDQPFE